VMGELRNLKNFRTRVPEGLATFPFTLQRSAQSQSGTAVEVLASDWTRKVEVLASDWTRKVVRC